MSLRSIVNRTIRKSGMRRRTLMGGLALLLTLTMTVPTWAVVFTNPNAITINDSTPVSPGNPYPSNISVSGMMGTTTNVTVTLLNINHTFVPDFDILLVAPGGNNLILMSDASSSNDVTNTTITFSDAAAATIPTTGTLPNGTFKPTNVGAGDTFPAPAPAPSANTTLAASFNGIDPNGTWALYVVDDTGIDIGTIGNGWSLTVTTTMSSATTFSNGAPIYSGDGARTRATPYASTIVSSGLTGEITDVNVTLTNFNHTNPDDVDILLVGPSGKRIMLMSDVGGSADAVNVNLTFDDSAAGAVPDAGPLVTGTFKPTNIGAGDTIPDLPLPNPNPTTAGTATLASVFNGTTPNGTWSLYVVDDVGGDVGSIMGGWSVDITAGGMGGAKRFTSGDIDGDGLTDIAVFRPSDSNWYYRESPSSANRAYPAFGSSGDILVPADYDGDRKMDFAVFRPSTGIWYIVQSTNSTLRQVAWGTNGDTPVPADYDGDGLEDVAVWRSGVWYVQQSTNSATRVVSWGVAGDKPVRGYFAGGPTDGASFTVFRPSNNNWYVLNNAASSSFQFTFGASGDVLAPADYDGDGRTDAAVFRGSTGDFYVFQSSNNTVVGYHWGVTGDVPVPGDYDGDSRADVAVFRPSSGSWYILSSGTTAVTLKTDNWGQPGDIAVPYTYLPQ